MPSLPDRLRVLRAVLARPRPESPAWRADAEEAAARVMELLSVGQGTIPCALEGVPDADWTLTEEEKAF